jgi:hypothetical protein
MRKQLAGVALLMLLFAGVGSSALLTRALAQPKSLTAIERAKRLGPKPTPHWYWRWAAWRLGEGYAKDHALERRLRPTSAPRHIPVWAWQRLHFFRSARKLAASGRKGQHGSHTTTTSTTTTTTSTTTTGTTTTSSAAGTYDQAIAYTQTPPAFTPARVIEVSDAASFRSAIANLQAGDLVKATAPFTVSGETIIGNRLASYAVLDLGSYVTFDYGGGLNYPAVWLKNPAYLRIYGGTLTTEHTGGNCILGQGMQHVLWWGFTCHDAGSTGVALYPVLAEITNCDFQGEVYKAGENLAWDPHLEKGSGLHGVNLDDSGQYAFSDNRFAFYIHDQPSGAGIEYGSRGTAPVRNTIYEKAVNLTFVSTTQTGGNAIQFWGVGGQSADIKYLEVENAQGYALFDGGMYSGTSLSGVTTEFGDATSTNLSPRYAGQHPWQTDKGVVYLNVQPLS